MKVVTLCGSMRFSKQMQKIAIALETKHGCCVITPVVDADVPISAEAMAALGKAHYRKIDLADAVYIVNLGGYIGEAVSKEICYAREHNKEIVYHE